MTIKAEELADTVKDILNDELAAVGRANAEEIPKIAKEAAKIVRREAPRSDGKGSGEYARTWTSKSEIGRLQTSAVVYAKAPGYKLAHLLEYSHALRNGERSTPQKHVGTADEWVNEVAVDRIAKAIEEAQG